MLLHTVHIRGFRNFKEISVRLNRKALLIGYNDVGKTNLTYALRLLLDNSIPDAVLTPRDSDFYAYEETHTFEITLTLTEVTEDCLISRFKHYLSDDGTVLLRYTGYRDPETRKLNYGLSVGSDIDNLEPVQSRWYLRVLSLRFIEGKRDFSKYIKRERKSLLAEARNARSEPEAEADLQVLGTIAEDLDRINTSLRTLNYVKNATSSLNTELARLSHRNNDYAVVFDTGSAEPMDYVDALELYAHVEGKSLAVGGDGRHNQIQLALWTARNMVAAGADVGEVCLYVIEEPEAHLHPHQQRKLAAYLAETLDAQVILTTHSPQIACEFPPESVVRLYEAKRCTHVAGDRGDGDITSELISFGHRLNLIAADTFFASAVLLVEGPSEVLLYRAMSRVIGIDLDRLNISVLSVDGVGFETYARLLKGLRVPFAIRTDNDIFRIPHSALSRFAGVQRAVDICQKVLDCPAGAFVEDWVSSLSGFDGGSIPTAVEDARSRCIAVARQFGVFLAEKDLEHDLYYALPNVVQRFLEEGDASTCIRRMQEAKATTMFSFLRAHSEALSDLAAHSISAPLHYCATLLRRD
jgi:putative ATP-dependent endonuclease of OLD family